MSYYYYMINYHLLNWYPWFLLFPHITDQIHQRVLQFYLPNTPQILVLLSPSANPGPRPWYLCKRYPPIWLSSLSPLTSSPWIQPYYSFQREFMKGRPKRMPSCLIPFSGFLYAEKKTPYYLAWKVLHELLGFSHWPHLFADLSVSETFKFTVWRLCTCYFLSMRGPLPVLCTAGSFHSGLSSNVPSFQMTFLTIFVRTEVLAK